MNSRAVELKKQVTRLFEENYHETPEQFFQAPGRVNLIGEHTDYNDGFVLPCAIDYQAMIAASPRNDDRLVVSAANYEGQVTEFQLSLPVNHSKEAFWSNYIRGVASVLLEAGYPIKGANIAIAGNVPQGAGLSSSACLEVVTALTLTSLSGLEVSLKELAVISQRAENEFVGCNCGIMDQMVSACGQENHAMLLDCRTLETRSVPIPDNIAVMIINSNIKRGLVDSEYNTRRQQCETAAAHYGVKALRDLNIAQLESGRGDLDDIIYRRARHIVTENQRTLDAAEALSQGNIQKTAALMAASHASMRDGFEITVPGIDAIVDMVKNVIGSEGGVRMTGGGFGGCVVALVPLSIVNDITSIVLKEYPAVSGGLKAEIYLCQPSLGAGTI